MSLGILSGPIALSTKIGPTPSLPPPGLCLYFPLECQNWTSFSTQHQAWILRLYGEILKNKKQGRAVAGLGATALGATRPADLAAYFPYEYQHWSEYDEATQQQILSAYNAKKAQLNAELYTLKKEGGCDATVAGRLAGQLKEVLIKAGADTSKLDSNPAVFGAGECGEWWRIFGHAPTIGEATSAVPSTYFGGIKITLSTVCGSKVTLPACPPPPPPPVITGGGGGGGGGGEALPVPVLAPTKPKMSTANMLLLGGGLAAVAVVGYAVAKKKGWIKT